MMQPGFFMPVNFISDIVFTILAVMFCFLIYTKTKESYQLTKYKGIKYFRDAFLFFGISYILRFFLSIMFLSRLFLPGISLLLIILLGYFSTISIFYLIFSTVWKKFNNKKLLVIGHSLAVFFSLASFFSRSHLMILHLQCFLLVAVVILSFLTYDDWKKLSKIKVLYLLVAILWLLNLFILNTTRPFHPEIMSQLVSLFVFFIIYKKISKWVK